MQLFLSGYPLGHLDDEIVVVAGMVANFGKVSGFSQSNAHQTTTN